ncbi:helix-turn-helix domain-containing protein [Streptomyces alfalfae]|uniref:helix-turn-helix transcriptional regulator n=1 Tax=Streptomyces alfalfae TaxID=1642299 RepID=UPI001BAD1B9D|nr:helix-turn-helix transcriptional regulator [Streptomyces alfalfae]QUI32471.1 helix-turn-helix domain-containing protein [Streptomyces alfalfae]
MGADEQAEAGRVAEEVFLQQMRRRRQAWGLSQAELAERVSSLGETIYQQTIAKIESGSRAVKLQEADLIARALGTSVAEMLMSSAREASLAPGQEEIERVVHRIATLEQIERELSSGMHAAREEEYNAEQRAHAAREAMLRAEQMARAARVRSVARISELEAVMREKEALQKAALDREAELIAAYGPRWREKIRHKEPINVQDLAPTEEQLNSPRERDTSSGAAPPESQQE